MSKLAWKWSWDRKWLIACSADDPNVDWEVTKQEKQRFRDKLDQIAAKIYNDAFNHLKK